MMESERLIDQVPTHRVHVAEDVVVVGRGDP